MFLVGIITWWYGRGWREQFAHVRDRFLATTSFFSIGQLLSTLFSPFRQISAGRVNGSAGVQLRAFFDQTLSRVIGAIVRTMTILFGIIAIIFQAAYELIVIVFWLLIPLLPLMGVIAMVIGWVPQWQ